jgi:hypothetical protein|tara:strand:+ start:341 stop:559 length:219 start_codon:yes stop_codon:yes gene_type:complete
MRKENLLGKKVTLINVHCMETIDGLMVETLKDVTGILEKLGSNDFFGWEICATLDGNSYKLKTLSQVQPIYR